MGIRFRGELATEGHVSKRLAMIHWIGVPAFEKLSTPWHWVWLVAPERYDQVQEGAPDYVHVLRQRYQDDGRPLPPGVVAEIPGDRFLSARLDSDDAYLPESLDRLAQQEWGADVLINLARGWTWEINEGFVGYYGFKDRKQGHYLLATNESREGMLDTGGDHTKARRKRDWSEIVHDRENRSWLQVAHGDNMWGAWRGKEKLSHAESDEVLESFGIDRETARREIVNLHE